MFNFFRCEVSLGKHSPLIGSLISWTVDGRELLLSPLEPCFWRAPTDNDRGNRMSERHAVWRDAAAKRVAHGVRFYCEVDGNWRVIVDLAYPGAALTGAAVLGAGGERRCSERVINELNELNEWGAGG